MLLKILVLVAAIGQVIGAVYLSIGTFEDATRVLPVFIQPAGWAFSIWGLIYTLSLVYAVYQIIPKYDNPTLKATRLPALLGFTGSVMWLYFAGMSDWLTWLTIPTLFIMAALFTKIVTAPKAEDVWATRFSRDILLPYAAWTGIAAWVNVQALLIERSVVTTDSINLITNVVLFAGLAAFTLYYYHRSNYSAWYGGVMVWASAAVAIANYAREAWLFTILASAFAAVTIWLYYKKVIDR